MALCLVADCGREAWHRYACDRCTERMRRHLREIDTYAEIIVHSRIPGRRGESVRRAPGFESTSPGDDDRIVTLDYRSRPTGDGPDDRERDTRSLLGTLHGMARWVRSEAGQDEPAGEPTVTREILCLLPLMDWCATRQWVDEIAADLADLHVQCRHLAGDAPPRHVGTCLGDGCDGRVYPAMVYDEEGRRVPGGRCRTCRGEYDWLTLVREMVIDRPQGIIVNRETLAAYTGLSVHTIRLRCKPVRHVGRTPLYDLDQARDALAHVRPRRVRTVELPA